MFSEDCDQLVASYVHGDFKEYFSLPIYDEYEDDYSNIMYGKTTVGSTSPRLGREESENSRTNASPYFPNSKTLCQGGMLYLLDLVEENDCVFAEAYQKDEVLTSES